MEPWQIILILSGIAIIMVGFYCLHRLLLKWEAKGYIYYLKKKAGTGGGNAIMEMQKILEPQVVHAYELKLEQPRKTEKGKDGTTNV